MSKRPRDLNQLAALITRAASGDIPQESGTEKNPAAVALGRLGGRKGGKARAAKLTPEQRKAIAEKAARSRWKKASVNRD